MSTTEVHAHGAHRLSYDKAANKFEYAKTEAPAEAPRIGLRWNRKLNTTRIGLLPAEGEKAQAHPVVSLEIIDKDLAHELDPLLLNGTKAHLWHTLGEAVAAKALRVTPMPTGTEPSIMGANLSLDVYEAIVADLGVDDDGSSTEEWVKEGLAAAREVLRDPPPASGLPRLKGEPEVRLRQAESVARWYGVPAARIVEATGRAYEPRRGMLTASGKSRALSLNKAKADAEAARIAEEARVRDEVAKTPNDRTMSALGLVGLAVPNDGFAQLPPGMTYPLPVRFGGQRDRMPVVFPIHTDRSGTDYYVWPAIEALPLPAEGNIAGCTLISPDEVLPVVPATRLAAIAEQPPVDALYHFTVSLRRRFLPDVDRGPLESWSRSGVEQAREIVKRFAPLFGRQRDPMRRWQLPHALELVVRGLKVRPDRALALFLTAIEERKVDAGEGVRDEIERMALAAAAAGEVETESLLTLKQPTKGKR